MLSPVRWCWFQLHWAPWVRWSGKSRYNAAPLPWALLALMRNALSSVSWASAPVSITALPIFCRHSRRHCPMAQMSITIMSVARCWQMPSRCWSNYGTVILCGLMERYNDPALSKPLDLALPIIKRAVMRVVVTDFEDRRAEFVDFVAPRIADGRIRYREDRATGIAATGAHFARLMRGENLGKSIVVLGDEVTLS